MIDRERAIKAIRRGVPLGEVVLCACHSTPPRRNGCFGVCEDSVQAIIASYEDLRRETPIGNAQAQSRAYEAARANLREAWDALAMIRETVETLAPSGSVKAAEHLDGPTLMHEADALVAGIMAIASLVSSTHQRSAKCGCETKGEAALVDGKIWCHPCADMVPSTPPQTLPSEMLYTPEEAEPHIEGAVVTSTTRGGET